MTKLFLLFFVINSAEAIANAKNSNIRFFKVPYGLSATAQDSIVGGEWVTASSKTAGNFSATTYFSAKKLQQELNIPIGTILSAFGGTPAEACTSKNALKELGDFNQVIDEISGIEEKTKSWFKNKEEFDGTVWLRNIFIIKGLNYTPDKGTLLIGSVDDIDTTYINGEYVSGLLGTGHHHTLREYNVHKSILKTGKNTIPIRVIDTGVPGEILGRILLKPKTEALSISLEEQWKKKLIADIYNGLFVSYDIDTDISKHPDLSNLNSNSPTVLYNAMINRLVPYIRELFGIKVNLMWVEVNSTKNYSLK